MFTSAVFAARMYRTTDPLNYFVWGDKYPYAKICMNIVVMELSDDITENKINALISET